MDRETLFLTETLKSLFESQVVQTPENLAILCTDQQLSYSELNKRANQLAHYLLKQDVGPHSRIGICLDRSETMIIGVLGVLKMEAAYVPLDPTYPFERLQFMLHDSEVQFVLSHSEYSRQLRSHFPTVTFLDLDDAGDILALECDENLLDITKPQDPAYILYTSGSTGKPKGAIIAHSSLGSYLTAIQQVLHIQSNDRYLHTASLSFSAATRQTLLPLTTGACLVIADFEQRADSLQLFTLIRETGVTIWDTVPSVWSSCISTLLELPEQQRLHLLDHKLRQLLTTGEALDWELPQAWLFQLKQRTQCINLYSQTETAGTVCAYTIIGDYADKVGHVPLGQPLSDAKIYLLDEDLHPVAAGSAGEIYISSPRLASGYIHQPKLTEEKFLANPFDNQPGARIYKTGDRGRYLDDATLISVGRSDRRVKIRGFRVEPEEVEQALEEHPAVQKAVVLAKATDAGTQQLAAYVVLETSDIEPTILLREMRHLLKQKLPAYMAPSSFHFLESLPLTSHGKIDYQSLSHLDISTAMQEQDFVAPRNAMEARIAHIWAQTLHLNSIGVHDDFFACGGDSLLATQIMARLSEVAHVHVTLRAFFAYPTIAQLAEHISSLQQHDQPSSLPALIATTSEADEIPLSFQQQRLWFLHQLQDTKNAFYTMHLAVRLFGRLDQEALQKSLNLLVARHAILRSKCRTIEGEARLVISPAQPVEISVRDLSYLSSAEREDHLRDELQREVQRPFDLENGPLFRVFLFQIDEQEHVFLCTMHHIVSDGWSKRILWRELTQAYNAFTHQQQPAYAPPLKLQYTDFAVWQRQWKDATQMTEQINYWKEHLQNIKPVLHLPTDHPRPAVQTYRGGQCRIELSRDLTHALKALARREGVSLYMVLLAAWQTLLYRYSGESDLALGTPIAHRIHPDLEPLIGFFANTLVLRTDLSGNPPFQALLQRVREVAFAAHAHQDLPLEKLVEVLQPERSLSHQPLFQVMFALQHEPLEGNRFAGILMQPLDVDDQSAKFDLSLFLNEDSHSIHGNIEYSSDLFEATTIQRMVGHYLTLLQSVVTDATQPLDTLNILPEDERQQLLVTWNSTRKDFPSSCCLHQLFEAQVARTPERVALRTREEALTYQQLNERANQFARYLQQQGIGVEQRVGVCLERSSDLVIALLAILKAGSAYVPLDPTYPAERQRFILADSQATILVTHKQVSSELGLDTLQTIHLDQCWPEIITYASTNLDCAAKPENLAYVIYTSGSTGMPKGVAIEHHSPVTLSHWAREVYTDDELTGVLAGTSICFDLSIFEIFVPLSWGGCVIMVGNALALAELPETTDVRLINTVPSVMTELLRLHALPPSVRTVNLAGEALPARLVQQAYQQTTVQKVYNLYGPSEDTTYSTYALLPHDLAGIPPIGRPIANTQVYVLDAHQQPVPIGVPGELYLGGASLARGYLDRPELNQQRFIPDPFSSQANNRLYCTGDQVRYREDGQLEFLGRLDQQVKLRGFRIELGEIEVSIGHFPFVKEVAVTVRSDEIGDRLVAYVVMQPAHTLEPIDLQCFLAKQLPLYMHPTEIVVLDALPHTPNGKVDRHALPAPQQRSMSHASDTPYVAPRTSLQQQLTTLWEQILQREQISIYDNFFALGGHSLLATQLLYHIQQHFHVALPLHLLFERPTIAEQALTIDDLQGKGQAASQPLQQLPQIVADPEQQYQPFPLTDVQYAYWIGRGATFELGNVATHIYTEIENREIDIDRLNHAWQRLIERHDMLRAIILPGGQQQVLSHVPPYQIRIHDFRHLDSASAEQALLEIRERLSHQVLQTDRWPLFDVQATLLPEQRVRIHMSIDALLFDGWSLGLLSEELAQLYANSDATLAPLSLTFRDYVLAEQDLQKSPRYDRALTYWRAKVEQMPPAPELPVISNPQRITKPHFVRRSGYLDAANWQALKEQARQVGITPSVILLAAYSKLLAIWSKKPRFTLNLTLFNRLPLHPEVNKIIGDFTSLTLLSVNAAEATSFADYARSLQKHLWEDLEHRYVNGIQVMRLLAQQQGRTQGALMPVVFTSLLTNQEQATASSNIPMSWLGEIVYRISQTPQVWLDHQVREHQGALTFHWDAVDEMFPAGFLDEMFDVYCHFLHNLAQDKALWQATTLELTSESQRQTVQHLNATAAPTLTGLLQDGFIQQALLHPEALAVITPRRQLHYSEIYQQAMRVAHWLRQRGACPNQLVAVVMEKGWEQVVAVLGILISGAAYVPLDASQPRERLWYLLHHSEVRLLLTQSSLEPQLPWPDDIQRLNVDGDLDDLPDQPLDAVQNNTDLAYVIFTSGSTGIPKGVMIDHRGALNTIHDVNQRFHVQSSDRVLALSALNFDLSVYDIFGLLSAGGCIVMPNARAARDPSHWIALINQAQVTIWNSVPALMSMLIEYLDGDKESLHPSLRLVMMSGDWIPVSLPERIWALDPQIELISMGGATEASIWSIIYPITHLDPSWPSIPYGHAMVNQHFYVLNEQLALCPTWVPGDLYIGGIGLAKGYWHDEEKTHKSFFVHPRTGERLYRTGDLGRYLPDGEIEFLGREDFQVKIKGHRIELGEIEATLSQHSGVQAAIVTTTGDPHGDKQLVAYVVPAVPAALTIPPAMHADDSYASDQIDQDNQDDQINTLHRQIEQFMQAKRHPQIWHDQADEKPRLQLLKSHTDDELRARYRERLSIRHFKQQPITFRQFSDLLACLRQVELGGIPKYLYPSGGSLYPIQVYLHIKPGRIQGCLGGTYYYHQEEHVLLLINENVTLPADLHFPVNQPVYEEAAFSIFLIGQIDIIEAKYPHWGRDFCLLEAGYIGQILMETATPLQLGLCPIGSLNFEPMREAFALQESQVLVHSFLGGLRDPEQEQDGWSLAHQHNRHTPGGKKTTRQPVEPIEPVKPVTPELLHDYLKQKLPAYMLPSLYMLIESLPLSDNGKVDRKQLPAPNPQTLVQKRTFVAPRSQVEQRIAEVWREVLHLENVGIADNFFDLGGNSFHMVRVYNRVRKTIDINLSLVEMFFRYPTIQSLADFLTNTTTTTATAKQPTNPDSNQDRTAMRQEILRQQRTARLRHRQER